MSLSRERALSYIRFALDISSPEAKFTANKLDLLKEITSKLSQRLPFHNLTLLSKSKNVDERTANDLQQNINSLLTCNGGLCWENNSAVHLLIQALGYDTYMAIASFVQFDPNMRDDHAVIIVKNVCKKGDTYLVDVAYGSNPCFEPVCLDFPEPGETELLTYSIQTFKYVKRDHKVLRMANDDRKYAIKEGEWGLQYFFELTPCPLDEMRKKIQAKAHSNPESIVNKFPIIIRWMDNKGVIIKGTSFRVEGPGKDIQVEKEMSSIEEVLNVCLEYFPTIKKEQILKAYNNMQGDYFNG